MNEIDINKKYRTRYGLPARVICVDAKSGQPVIALITTRDGHEIMSSHHGDGRYFHDGKESNRDLIEVPELEFDWSCLPAWAEWITQSAGNSHCWVWWEKKPLLEDSMYNTFKGEKGLVHHEFSPRYNGSDPAPIFKRPSKEGGEA